MRRHDDGELCGYVDRRVEQWCALSVFGAVLGRHGDGEAAAEQVLSECLSALAERWTLRNGGTGGEQVVCIQEATPDAVTLALDYYSLPGVPTLTVTPQQLASGEWELIRR